LSIDQRFEINGGLYCLRWETLAMIGMVWKKKPNITITLMFVRQT